MLGETLNMRQGRKQNPAMQSLAGGDGYDSYFDEYDEPGEFSLLMQFRPEFSAKRLQG